MSKFPRGSVVYHKTMGIGVAINDAEDGQIEVRMQNGQINKFYPEELETEEEVMAKHEQNKPEKWNIGK